MYLPCGYQGQDWTYFVCCTGSESLSMCVYTHMCMCVLPLIILKKTLSTVLSVHYITLKNLPIMLYTALLQTTTYMYYAQQMPHYAQIMLVK